MLEPTQPMRLPGAEDSWSFRPALVMTLVPSVCCPPCLPMRSCGPPAGHRSNTCSQSELVPPNQNPLHPLQCNTCAQPKHMWKHTNLRRLAFIPFVTLCLRLSSLPDGQTSTLIQTPWRVWGRSWWKGETSGRFATPVFQLDHAHSREGEGEKPTHLAGDGPPARARRNKRRYVPTQRCRSSR